MKQTILLAGTGGQGVQIFGKLLAYCANAQGLHVTMDAKYSGNMRGSPSNCTVIISDRMIGNPVERSSDHLIAFTPEAMCKLLGRVVPNGTVWRDSTLSQKIPEGRADVTFFSCPASKLAEELGNIRCANIVMAGYLAERMDYLDADCMRKFLPLVFEKKPELMELNELAFDCGAAYARGRHTS